MQNFWLLIILLAIPLAAGIINTSVEENDEDHLIDPEDDGEMDDESASSPSLDDEDSDDSPSSDVNLKKVLVQVLKNAAMLRRQHKQRPYMMSYDQEDPILFRLIWRMNRKVGLRSYRRIVDRRYLLVPLPY